MEELLREVGRIILEHTLRNIETDDRADVPKRIDWQGEIYRLNRKTNKQIDTRFGSIGVHRWYYQALSSGVPGLAPLDLCLGLIAGRMTPALAEVVGRLVADMPQQAVLLELGSRFLSRLRVCFELGELDLWSGQASDGLGRQATPHPTREASWRAACDSVGRPAEEAAWLGRHQV